MKKILLFTLLTALVIGVQAQKADFSGITLFINPGHGGLDGDDRHMLETDFWESQGNLSKGLQLRDLLLKKNATVYMSRTLNRSEDDLALSAIAAMANDANSDFFLSIHSNGFDGQRNQPLVLFRGYDNAPVYPESKVLANILFDKLIEKGDIWTNTTRWVQGDWTFYPSWGTSGLGVLRPLTIPGVLSEGSFHDYIAEGWRLKNQDYLLSESWAFFNTFAQYFNVLPETDGRISGVVRNPLKSPGYYVGSSSKDIDIPINNALVTLTPGNKTYRIDNSNNGYFLLDSIAPGDYQLTFSGVPNFYDKTIDVTVTADKNIFLNVLMQQDITLVPRLVSLLPGNSDSIILNPEFVFTFDLNMDTEAVKNALTITPSVDLTYSWSEKNTILKVKPTSALAPKTDYTLSLSSAATSQWGVALSQELNRKYSTINHTELVLLGHYPANNATELSTYLQVQLQFNAPINASTISGNVTLKNASQEIVPIKNIETSVKDGKGYLYFEPQTQLDLNSNYTVTVNKQLLDSYGQALSNVFDYSFTTRTQAYASGTVIETYDNVSSIWDPNASGSTVGTIDQETTFALETNKKIQGTGSGRLNYAFSGASGGVCRAYNSLKPAVGGGSDVHVACWVFGDRSNNALAYWFYSPGNQIVNVATIDWAGWELKSIPKSQIPATGSIQFHSIVINQKPGGALSGTLFFDAAQYYVPQVSTGVEEVTDSWGNFSVFPNPIKTEATIEYNLKNNSDVSIEIYDLSGKLIETIYSASNSIGEHTTRWIPNENTTSGIYFAKIQATNLLTGEKQSQSLKLVVEK